MGLMTHERRAFEELRDWLLETFGVRLHEMALFGSRARGEADEDSDVDVLVVVDDLTWAEGRVVAEQCGDFLTRDDLIVSTFSVSSERWRQLCDGERLIASEIARDGIRYWPVAAP